MSSLNSVRCTYHAGPCKMGLQLAMQLAGQRIYSAIGVTITKATTTARECLAADIEQPADFVKRRDEQQLPLQYSLPKLSTGSRLAGELDIRANMAPPIAGPVAHPICDPPGCLLSVGQIRWRGRVSSRMRLRRPVEADRSPGSRRPCASQVGSFSRRDKRQWFGICSSPEVAAVVRWRERRSQRQRQRCHRIRK